jgi:methyltransferase-like protein/SAM-dependent methyltransferase
MTNSYNEVPYPDLSYGQSHPDRMATLATLLSLNPAPVDNCRVLEIGCAGGGNIIPMAYALPHSTFVGIDYAERQIEAGQALLNQLGLSNITLQTKNILDIGPDFGQFDYIIAHGIYSWVPTPVQEKLLQVCQQNLAPQGVAYISYNTYPGWNMMGSMREAMLYHARFATSPQEKAMQARAMLDFLIQAVPSEDSAFGNFLGAYHSFVQRESKGIHVKDDAFLLHDELEANNHPLYFHQFIEQAQQYDLQYLVEADFANVLPNRFPPEVAEQIQAMAGDVIELEQYMDFVRNRMFRQTLLCHADLEINRALKPDRVTHFYIASQAKPVSKEPDIHSVSVEQFKGFNGATLSLDHPLSKSAMLYLSKIWPQAVSFTHLLNEARLRLGQQPSPEPGQNSADRDAYLLAANLLKAYSYSSQLVEFHRYRPPYTMVAGDKPLASAVARLQAKDGTMITNLWHDRVHLNDLQRYLLPFVDGTRSRQELLTILVGGVAEGKIKLPEDILEEKEKSKAHFQELMGKELSRYLHWLGRATLLLEE